MRIAFIGAGSLAFGRRLLIDILSFGELSDSTIALVDVDAEALNRAERMALKIVERLGAPAQIVATTDRARALDGADFVITMFRAGGPDVEMAEILTPLEKYGLRQTVADTLGFGGVCRSLRTVPTLLAIARDMERLCPHAYLLNYTNPMAINTWAVYRATSVRIVGLCHSVQGTSRTLARYIGAPYEEISYKTAGINHMAWFLEFRRNGRDAYPALREAMENPEIFARDPVRFEIMRHFGYFVTESTRHMAEYVPYFLQHDDVVREFGLKPIDAERYRDWRTGRDDRSARELELVEDMSRPLPPRSREYAARIIHSIVTGRERCIYGSVENTGLIPNLPQGCAVEVPCLVNKNGIQGCYVGELPPQLAALNRTNINVQELVVRGILEENLEHIYHAAMLDPNTASVLTLRQIRELLDERLSRDSDWMPEWVHRQRR